MNNGEAFAFYNWKVYVQCYCLTGWNCYVCHSSWKQGRR